jgi:small multidrug resistance family-3 protein
VARTYAAYGGVYITVALAWLSPVESHRPNRRDIIVARMSLIEVSIIILGNRGE